MFRRHREQVAQQALDALPDPYLTGARLDDLVDGQRHVVLPVREPQQHAQVALGVGDLAYLEVAADQHPQQALLAVEGLDGRRGVVDRRRQGPQGDVDQHAQRERGVLLERARRAGPDRLQHHPVQ